MVHISVLVLAMNEIEFARTVLRGEPEARARFIQRYSDDILKAILKVCRGRCQGNCALRFRLDRSTLNAVRCDELSDMYLFSIEYITKSSLKYFKGNIPLDDWMKFQLNTKGDYFKYMFNAYLAKKYPITGKARVPDRFKKIWSKTQKNIYKTWLRGKSIPEIADKSGLSEEYVQKIVDDLIHQLEEAGLLGGLMASLSFEEFDARRSLTEKRTGGYKDRIEDQPETNTSEEETDDALMTVPTKQSEPITRMLVDSLKDALDTALSKLSTVEYRLLALKFDKDYTLAEIAKVSERLNLGNPSASQVGHLIDDILKRMLPTINRQIDKVDDVNLQLKGLKRILTEWGVRALIILFLIGCI